MSLYAIEHGTKTTIYSFSHYDKTKNSMYLYNFSNMVYKIEIDNIELLPNGTDGFLFLNHEGHQKFEICSNVSDNIYLNKLLIDPINFEEDALSVDENKFLFNIYIHSIFFESLMPTKVLVYFVGEKGSGKSASAKKLGKMLFGKKFDVTPLVNDPSDFDVAITNSAFICIDNADSRQEWLEDRLATVATGGVIKKRALYTSNTMLSIESHCFVALTARTPQVRRDDLADRMLIFRLKRLENFRPENLIIQEILDNRNILLSEMVRNIQKTLRKFEDLKDYNFEGKLRMGDFADFAYKFASITNNEELISRIFNKLEKLQSDFSLENDPIIEFIDQWLSKRNNQGRFVTTKELFNELKAIALDEEGIFLLKNHRSLAQKLRNINSNLRNYFIIEEREERGRTRKIAFWPLKYENSEELDSTVSTNILFN